MAGHIGKTTNSPRTAMAVAAQNERNDQIGTLEGKAYDYDPTTQTARIVISKSDKKDGEGNPLPYPDLMEIPIDFASSGKGGITMPVPDGTEVLLVSMGASSEESDGATVGRRSSNLSDMRATLVGGNKRGEGLANVDPDNLHIRADKNGQYGHRMSEGGKHAIEGVTGELLDILASGFEALAAEVAVVSSGSSAGSWAISKQGEYAAIAAKLRGMKI